MCKVYVCNLKDYSISPSILVSLKKTFSTICLFTVNHVANLAGSALCEVLFTKASLRDEVHGTEIVSDRTLLPKQVLA